MNVEQLYVSLKSPSKIFDYIKERLWLLWLRVNNWKITYNGIKLDIDNPQIEPHRSFSFSTWANRGVMHEEEEAQLLTQHLKSDTNVIELGAGIGFISCYIDSLLSESSVQVAVEGNPKLIDNLEKNKEMNNASFSIENIAYSPEIGTTTFHLGKSYLTASTEPKRINSFWGQNRTVEESVTVNSKNFKYLVDKYNLSRVSLIVDIEGDEIDLINTELELLEEVCEFILIEFHYHPEDSEPAQNAKQTLIESEFELVESSGVENMVETCVFKND